jgi:hypothetical protein
MNGFPQSRQSQSGLPPELLAQYILYHGVASEG